MIIMKRTRPFPPFLIFIIALSLGFTSCVENGGTGGKRSSSNNTSQSSPTGGTVDNNGSGAGRDDGSVGNVTDEILEGGIAELRHIIDPFSGTYKTKVTAKNTEKFCFFYTKINFF